MKIKCNISNLPKAPYTRPKIPESKKPGIPFEAMGHGQTKKERDWSAVNRGINKGKMGRPRFYTPAQDAVIRQMRQEGKSFKEIGEHLGRTGEAIRRRWYAIR